MKIGEKKFSELKEGDYVRFSHTNYKVTNANVKPVKDDIKTIGLMNKSGNQVQVPRSIYEKVDVYDGFCI